MVAPDVQIDDGKGTILISSEEGETEGMHTEAFQIRVDKNQEETQIHRMEVQQMFQCSSCRLIFEEDWICKCLSGSRIASGIVYKPASPVQLSCIKYFSPGVSGFLSRIDIQL